ncbi:unnamed protein product [Sphagnum jensenii]|uniref:Metallo-beta-lactamase domain-containing protein n=1 Tax=Sphagnum jensenii TaxID=128206 RepID=A0ABP0X7D8_9BRYO
MGRGGGEVEHRVALIVKNADPSEVFQIFLLKQTRPGNEIAGGEKDSDIWDLASVPLLRTAAAGKVGGDCDETLDEERLAKAIGNVEFNLDCLGLKGFAVSDAVEKIQTCIHPTGGGPCKSWRYWKYVEEPAYGPGPAVHTIVFIIEILRNDASFSADGEWFDPLEAYNLLVGSDSKQKRIGPLATLAFSSHFPPDLSFKYNLCVQGQEYPPGIFIAPMESATMLPFSKTNLVVFAPTGPLPKHAIDTGAAKAFGDALICDPGCHPQLAKVVNELPRKLLVFLTHHHFDHIDGLPTVRKQNPQAIIIAHQKTLQRMGKATTGFNCIAVEGGSKLLIAGQELEIISAPGHTDGHLALLHRMTGTVLVGDHCVGQGSSVLDPSSGANMQDYLDTCNRLLDLEPKVIVPAHGKPNLWPANMLHTYIKHREEREAKVLDAILGGARTAYEVVAEAYKDTPAAFWPAALKNVKLHVEHLDYLHKLPPDFDLEEFERSAKIPFYLRCFPSVAQYALRRRARFGTPLAGGLSLVVVAGAVACLWKKKK